VVSKGRWKVRQTIRALEECGLEFRVVVEPAEVKDYAKVVKRDWLVTLGINDVHYYDRYWTDDDPRTGPGPARNRAWEDSVAHGFERHWVLDDNIEHFYRLNRNAIQLVACGAIFRAAEDFCDRYDNVGLAGFNYEKLVKVTEPVPAYYLNTRIYSCLLVRNDLPFRWRGRYNEDTDLSLRVLKSGLCTVLFNAFLAGKVTTQRNAGGNTAEFYDSEGTENKSQMLVDMHPDVARLAWKFNRVHHHVDYSGFRQRLKRREGVAVRSGINNYGMVLSGTQKAFPWQR
jgi:hypothetical protein